ncbi:MAG TPA: exodeoxyribonuclease VII large subunit [Ruminococcaceae bacterium]|nr:exodeoxyribonuclease VII large subunit [Oscillospiraceae bacterium]
MKDYLTGTALTKYLKYKFDSDENLRKVYIKGEISNYKLHTTGHLYFSIKDENSIIKAIMFSSNAKKLTFEPKEGMKVLVTGTVSVYPATGSYQIYVEALEEDGIGNLYIEFEKLKAKLASEGLFDPKYKKPIPEFPMNIGIVTASTGAAIRDILSTIKRRYPICKTYLFPCLVQGEFASADIVSKIKEANNYDLDVLIVGRGGGSFEDLNCFNDEQVARTIFESKIPIISAVGHEVDLTIADFVADLRAPTPTGAAEMAVPYKILLPMIKSEIHEMLIGNGTWAFCEKHASDFGVSPIVLQNRIDSLKYEIQQYLNGIPLDQLEILSISKQKKRGIVVKSLVDLENERMIQMWNSERAVV